MKTEEKLQIRKYNRLCGYDYSQDGIYFITICTKDKECLLGEIEITVGAAPCRPNIKLSKIGKVIDREIERFAEPYGSVFVDKYA